MSNEIFNSPGKTYHKVDAEKEGSKPDKEVFSFCGHIKQSISEMFNTDKPVQSLQVAFDSASDSTRPIIICGSSNDGRKLYAFE